MTRIVAMSLCAVLLAISLAAWLTIAAPFQPKSEADASFEQSPRLSH